MSTILHPVDFVLKDPHLKYKDSLATKTAPMLELDVVPKPWAKSYRLNQSAIRRSLHLTNPIIQQILNLWYKNYFNVRLIDSSILLTHGEVLELATFQDMVRRDIEQARTFLLRKYVYTEGEQLLFFYLLIKGLFKVNWSLCLISSIYFKLEKLA